VNTCYRQPIRSRTNQVKTQGIIFQCLDQTLVMLKNLLMHQIYVFPTHLDLLVSFYHLQAILALLSNILSSNV
jgi:hypothetical protein